MERIGMYDAKTRLSEIARLVKEAGRSFIITSRGEDMFQITPIAPQNARLSPEEAFDRIVALRDEAGPTTREENRADIEHGRR